MVKLIFLVLFCTLVDCSLAINQQEQLENMIFKTDYTINKLWGPKPENMEQLISKLNNIYSTSYGTYKDLTAKLAELPRLSSCEDGDFMKFDLLQSQSQSVNIKRYLKDQLISFSKKCDKKLVNEFFGIVNQMDRKTYDLTYRLSVLMTRPYGLGYLVGRPLFSARTLVEGIFWLIEEKNPAMSETGKMISKSELDSLYKSLVVSPCMSLTKEFDSMARFYMRNFLDRGTLQYCDDTSKGWTYRAEVCSKVLADKGNLPNLVYQIITKQNENPKANLYEIMDEVIPRKQSKEFLI